jgi:hypothetical protein
MIVLRSVRHDPIRTPFMFVLCQLLEFGQIAAAQLCEDPRIAGVRVDTQRRSRFGQRQHNLMSRADLERARRSGSARRSARRSHRSARTHRHIGRNGACDCSSDRQRLGLGLRVVGQWHSAWHNCGPDHRSIRQHADLLRASASVVHLADGRHEVPEMKRSR